MPKKILIYSGKRGCFRYAVLKLLGIWQYRPYWQ